MSDTPGTPTPQVGDVVRPIYESTNLVPDLGRVIETGADYVTAVFTIQATFPIAQVAVVKSARRSETPGDH